MKARLEKAMMLFSPSPTHLPSTEPERELLVALVERLVQEHGEEWVRSNFLMELEWRREKEKAFPA